MKKQIEVSLTFDFNNEFDTQTLVKYLKDRINYTLEANQFPDFELNFVREV